MAQIKRKTRADRRIAKKKYTRRFLSVVAVSAVFMSAFAYSKNSSAVNGIENKEVSLELSTEKIDRDTVKIQLDNFAPLVKSIQLNVAIDGNAKFKENTIKWLASSDSQDVKTHVKMGEGNKSMQIFIVSNEPLNRVGTNLEIMEVDLEKVSSGNSAYKINSEVVDGAAYSYVLSDTNKQVTGIDMANLSEDKLTINSLPVISLKPSNSIVDGNIVVSKGSDFDAKSYIVVNDEEDGEIPVDKVTVTGKVDTRKVSTYSITYSVTDNEGDTATLEQTVIVEDNFDGNITNPVITINKDGATEDTLTVIAGEDVNLSDYITAVDYLGRNINVEITGDYDLTTPGTYVITAVAVDGFGNVSEKEITLIVEKSDDSDGVVGKEYKIKATITNKDGKPVAGEKFNLYKVEVKKRLFRADSEELVYISTLESDENGEIYAELEEAGNYKLKQINSATGNEMADSEVIIELTEDNKGNVITIPDIVVDDNTSGEDGGSGDNGNGGTDNGGSGDNGNGGTDNGGSGDNGNGGTDNGGSGDNGNEGTDNGDSGNNVDEGTDNGGSGNSGNENTDNSNKPQVPVNPDSSENSNNIIEENKNDLPKTGQGIFYGVIIAGAIVVIGSGVYLVTKKKK